MQVARWGNGLAIRLPAAIVEALSLNEGDQVEIPVEAILARRCDTSVQILNEFVNVARRKLSMDWKEIEEAQAAIRTLCGTIHPVDIETHQRAMKLAERHAFPVFDALVVASALLAGCSILYSEDMRDGMEIDGRLRISNPFKAG